MGRKKKPSAKKKSERISIQCAPGEKAALEAAAAMEQADGVSSWLRDLGIARARKLGVPFGSA